ncbi:CAAX prenyl protease, partial [Haematococcus lacustris]
MALPAEVPYLHIYLAFTLGVSLLHWALDFRQLKALRNKDPPPELASAAFKDPNLYKKTQAYSLDKWCEPGGLAFSTPCTAFVRT